MQKNNKREKDGGKGRRKKEREGGRDKAEGEREKVWERMDWDGEERLLVNNS